MLIGALGTSPLLLLVLLACPIGMGVMMVFMGRGMKGGMKQQKGDESETGGSALAEMKAEQARLAEKIEALEGQEPEPKRAEPANDREPDRVT
jgi:hypothetical protein